MQGKIYVTNGEQPNLLVLGELEDKLLVTEVYPWPQYWSGENPTEILIDMDDNWWLTTNNYGFIRNISIPADAPCIPLDILQNYALQYHRTILTVLQMQAG